MSDQLDVLHRSADRLRRTVERASPEQLRAPAYPTEWTIADVLSHVGSGARIMRGNLDASLADRDLPDDFAQAIWDEWNAKTPDEKAAEALVADVALLDRLDSLTDEERVRFRFSLGPMVLDLPAYLGLRLNEHALHSWDIEVALDPSAVVAPDAVGLVIDNLGMISRFAGKPIGVDRELHVRTTEPERHFTLTLGSDSTSLEPCEAEHTADLELPAEAFIRLIYGRLDPEHTPPVSGDADLNELRRALPGL